MKNILGLIGSPRKLGNCDIMVKEICRNIPVEHTLSLAYLHDYTILPCKGCYHCLFKEGACVLEDDFPRIFDALANADALIVAVPTYFLSANASLKRFLERCLVCYVHIDKLWKKPAIGIGISGIKGKDGYTQLCLENFFTFLLMENKKSVILTGALPGEIFMDETNKKRAKELAQALFAPVQEKNTPCCPLCKGETFRFFDNNEVMCMLCSNRGTVSWRDNKPVFSIRINEPSMFLTKEEAISHRKWLMGMKERFIENKRKLKEITIDYLDDGDRI